MLSFHVKFVQTDTRMDRRTMVKNNMCPIFRYRGIKKLLDENSWDSSKLKIPTDDIMLLETKGVVSEIVETIVGLISGV